MHVELRQSGSTLIVDLEGRLVAGGPDEMFREVINELVAADWKHILLNLSGLKRIDSAGIGELVAAHRLVGRFGSQLKLVSTAGRIRDVLELSQVLPLLESYDDEAKAVASFKAANGDSAESAAGVDAVGE